MIGKILGFLDKILSFFEDWTLFISVMVALLALFFNVLLRYGFNYSLAWSEEVVREVIMYTTFIGCSVAVKNRSMIKIDALYQLVPGVRFSLSIFSNLAILVFSVMMIYYGTEMAIMQVDTNQKTVILQIPIVYLYAFLPLMGVSMFLRTLHVIYNDIAVERAKKA
ncbi:MAG: TRAP transporter small permease [Proteobacteria bacterium]|nr:TRAP transporter small permease [Pseudomonadota bacterium]